MSLINEALKKAQQPGASQPPLQQPPLPAQPQPPPPRTRKRGFFWGFFAAMAFVSIVSMLSVIVLTKILLDDGSGKAASAANNLHEEAGLLQQMDSKAAADTPPAPSIALETPAATEPSPAAGASSAAATTPAVAPAEPVASTVPPAAPVATPAGPESAPATATPAEPPTTPAAPATAQIQPSQDTLKHLRDLQIRGIMPGGNKVLIHDPRSGRTRSYEQGQALDDLQGWSIHSIQPSSIQLAHHDGFRVNKSF